MFTLMTCHLLLKTLWTRRVQSRSLPESVCAALLTISRRLNPMLHLQWYVPWNAIEWKPFHWSEEEVNAALADENSRMATSPVRQRRRPRSPGPISPNTERMFFSLSAEDPDGVAEPEALNDSPQTKKLKRWYQCEICVSDEENVPEMPESPVSARTRMDRAAPSSSSGPAPSSTKRTYKILQVGHMLCLFPSHASMLSIIGSPRWSVSNQVQRFQQVRQWQAHVLELRSLCRSC